MPITQQMLDEIMKEYQKPEDLLGESGLLKQLTKALVERALEGELTHHLGYEKHGSRKNGNARNGKYRKVIIGKEGEIEIGVPRDRKGEFERNRIVYQTRVNYAERP